MATGITSLTPRGPITPVRAGKWPDSSDAFKCTYYTCAVAQLNLYVSDDLAERLKQEARKARLPLSRYVLTLLSTTPDGGWPEGYFETVCGFLREDFAEPEDRLPKPVEVREG